MATIASQLRLNDGMSGVLLSINGALDRVIGSFERMQSVSGNTVDTAGLERARNQLTGLRQQIESVRAAQAEQAAPSWQSYGGLEVFGSAGLERSQQEIAAITAQLESVSGIQYRLTQAANEAEILSPEAQYDIEGIENRLYALTGTINQIGQNPLNIGTDSANAQLEKLRRQLAQIEDLQNQLNAAMEGADISEINQQYLRLSQQITQTEQMVRDSFQNIPPPTGVEIPVTWSSDGMNQLYSRLDTIRAKISQIESNPVNLETQAAQAGIAELRGQLDQAVQQQESLNQAVLQMDVSAANTAYAQLNQTIDDAERYIRENVNAQGEFNQSVNQGTGAADGLLRKLRSIAGMIGVAFSIKNIIGLADTMTQTESRLNLITGSLEETKALQDQIMQSANRSRAAYQSQADAVAKLGLMAGSAFSSENEVGVKVLNTNELIAFTELLNKQFTIAGTSAQGIEAAMLQLTQAMGSGVLRGEEYNSILEQAPNIVQNIAKYIESNDALLDSMAAKLKMKSEDLAGNVQGKLKDIASEGLLTADLVKSAMFYAADDINAQFESMPYTFSQVATMVQNILLDTFQPLIQVIGSGAQFIHDNWSTIAPILVGVAAAVGVLTAAYLIHNAVVWLSVEANRALIASMLSNPFLWVAVVIGVLVGAIYAFIQSVGGARNAWEIAKQAILVSLLALKLGFFTGVYAIMELVDRLKLCWASAGVAVSGYMGDMKVNVLTILQSMINSAIDLINGFIEKLNTLPGVSLDAVQQVTFAATAAAENEAAKQAKAQQFADYTADIEAAQAERDSKLKGMQADLSDAKTQLSHVYAQSKAEAAASSTNDMSNLLSGVSTDVGDINRNSAAAAGALSDTSESLEYLRDIAEQEAINRFTTAEVKIDYSGMTNRIDSDMDVDGVLSRLTDGFAEALEIAAEGVHK